MKILFSLNIKASELILSLKSLVMVIILSSFTHIALSQQVASFTISPASVCSGSSVTITNTSTGITGTSTFIWNFGTGASQGSATGPGPFVITYTGSGTSTVSLTYQDPPGIVVSSITNNVTINALPVVTLASAGPFCINAAPVQLVGTPGGGTYSGTGTTATGTFTPATAGAGIHAITYTFTDANGCTSSGSTNVTVNALPAAPVVTVVNNCNNTSTLSTTATGTLLWSTGASTTSIIVSTPGIYTVTETVNGCTSPAGSGTAAPKTAPAAPGVGTITQPTCLTATGSVILTGLPAGNWTINPGTIAGSTATVTITGLAAGTHNFTVTDAAGCTSLPSANVVINAQPVTPTPPFTNVTQPTCTLATGTITVTVQNAAETYSFDNGASFQSGNSKSGLTAGTYDIIIKSSGGCNSVATATVINAQPSSPAVPVTSVVQPTCSLSTGTITVTVQNASDTYSFDNGSTFQAGNSKSGLNAGTYNIIIKNTGGCNSTATPTIVNAQPATPATPAIGTITVPTCLVSTGSVVINGLPSGSWTLDRYPGPVTTAGTGTTVTVSGLSQATYNFTVTSSAGCVSGVSSPVVIPAPPPTPAAPSVGTITQPTCSVATGSVVLNGLPSGNWTINPGAVAGSTASTTITGLIAGTYNFTVTNSTGCISPPSGNVVINAQPATPTAPVVGAITPPTCILATGSVVLSGLPASGLWTITSTPAGVTTTGTGTGFTIPALAAGTYTFTVSNAAGCTSVPSANVVIPAQPASPSAPTQTIDCAQGFGHAVITVTGPLGTGFQYSLDAGAFTSAVIFNGVANGSHTITVKNTSGCTTTGAVFSVSCGCVNGPVVTLSSITGNTCGITPVTITGNTFSGSATKVTISENGAGTISPASASVSPFSFTYTPKASDAGKSVIITVTTDNPLGSPCAAAVATFTLTVNDLPAKPVTGTITQPTCAVPTGSVMLSSLPATGTWTLTQTPGSTTQTGNGTSAIVSGLVPGTYTFTVTDASGCISPSSGNVVITAQPGAITPPVASTIVQPTCSISSGSVTLTGLPPSGTWTLTRNPGGVISTGTGSTTTITGLDAGIYTFIVSATTGCASLPSSNVVINAQPATPTSPTIGTVTQPTCTLPSGSVILGGLPATGTWSLTRLPGTVVTTGTGVSTTISGLSPGSYNFTVSTTAGCTSSTSGNVAITSQPGSPTAPVIGVITQPTCTISTGQVVLSGLPGTGVWTLTSTPDSVNISGTGTSVIVSSLTEGTYTFAVASSTGCISSSSGSVVITANASTPVLTVTNPAPVCFPATSDITASSVTAGSGTGLTFTYWTNSTATVPFNTPASAISGTYYIKATSSSSGCSAIKPVIVSVNQKPVANAGRDTVLNFQFSINLSAVPPAVNGTGKWSVLTGTGVIANDTLPATTVSNLSQGMNTLLWTVSNGVCPASADSLNINVNNLVIPTLITPNGDGRNDYFVIGGKDVLGQIELVIFDRTGKRVYKSANYNNDWNGVDEKGNPLPEDTYFYVIKTQSGLTISKYIVVRR